MLVQNGISSLLLRVDSLNIDLSVVAVQQGPQFGYTSVPANFGLQEFIDEFCVVGQ